ncbi:hypothetical protein ACHQM5_029497 [Ranunculus cassubicifolius]
MEGSDDGGEIPPEIVLTTTETMTSPADFPKKLVRKQLEYTPSSPATGTPENQPERQPPPPEVTRQHIPPPSIIAQGPPSRPPYSYLKPESPKRPRPIELNKDGTPKKQKQCNCKHSRCLKLYCECFASGVYCDGCNCVNCYNNVENEASRHEAVELTLERNPNAFRPKIANSPHGVRDIRDDAGEVSMVARHNKGCHCKKSGCLKKYCECFQANILCSDNCKCIDCKNYEGSEERRVIFQGDHNNSLYMQQAAANAAITGAVGTSGYGTPPTGGPFKRQKHHDHFFGATAPDLSLPRLGQHQQANHLKPSSSHPSSSSSTFARFGNPSAYGSSKSSYRSLLADVIQSNDVKELCSLLVVVAGEAASKLAENKKNTLEKEPDKHEEKEDNQKIENAEMDKTSGDDPDVQKEDRPMSPGTLALMCDEPETMFTVNASSDGVLGGGLSRQHQLPYDQDKAELYMEQERLLLTVFRDCLHQIITCGRIKEEKYSQLSMRNETREPEPIVNGSSKSHIQTPVIEVPQTNNSAPIGVERPNENGSIGKAKVENEL